MSGELSSVLLIVLCHHNVASLSLTVPHLPRPHSSSSYLPYSFLFDLLHAGPSASVSSLWSHLRPRLPHPPGCWSTSCRLSGEVTTTRWSRYGESCRTSRRRTTGSSSSWPRTSSCLPRPGSKPASNTKSLGSPTRTWYGSVWLKHQLLLLPNPRTLPHR